MLPSYPVGPEPMIMYQAASVLSVLALPAGFTRSMAGTAVVRPRSALEKLQSSLG